MSAGCENLEKENVMFGLGTPELLVIGAIAFMIFGGKRLPELGAGLGKGISSFKKGLRDIDESQEKTERIKANDCRGDIG